MTSKDSKKIINLLSEAFPAPKIPLVAHNSYTFLVAVILSAQCTDKRVNQTTPTLFTLADTPQKMIQLGKDKIQEIIRPCGLSERKSSSIILMSKDLVSKFDGTIPSTFEDLESLPGVGHKTASVIMSQVYQKPAFPVDTHIHRLAERWGISDGKNVRKTEKDLKKFFPEEKWNIIHLQMVFYGRQYCKARGHRLDQCPICRIFNKSE